MSRTYLIFLTALMVIVVFVLPIAGAQDQEKGYGYVSGKIVAVEGESMEGGRVYFYNTEAGPSPYSHKYWRSKDYNFTVGDKGYFSAILPEGSYYMVVLKKAKGREQGPPEEGDLIYPAWDGMALEPYQVLAGETTSVGVISKAVPFKKEWAIAGTTRIEGRVLDLGGKPVQGRLVFAFTNPVTQKPRYVSTWRTKDDGQYFVSVPEGGSYYVRVLGSRKPVVTVYVRTEEVAKGVDVRIELKKRR